MRAWWIFKGGWALKVREQAELVSAPLSRLRHSLPELLLPQRAVVHGAREAEAVLDEGHLAGGVAGGHGAQLREGDVRLVHLGAGGGGEGARESGGRGKV